MKKGDCYNNCYCHDPLTTISNEETCLHDFLESHEGIFLRYYLHSIRNKYYLFFYESTMTYSISLDVTSMIVVLYVHDISTTTSTRDISLQDFLIVLKYLFQNSKKILSCN